jgi:hypothetical protein
MVRNNVAICRLPSAYPPIKARVTLGFTLVESGVADGIAGAFDSRISIA